MSGKNKLELARELSNLQGVIDVEVEVNRLTIITKVEKGNNGQRRVPSDVANRAKEVLEGTSFVPEGNGEPTAGEFHINAPGYTQNNVMKKNFVKAIST